MRLLVCLIQQVGLQEKKLILQGETIVTANLDLTGMQYLWDVATEARCHNVATRASTALLKLHVVCSLQLQEQAISIRRTMIEDILQKLLSAVKVIIETPDVAADDNHIIGRPLPSARLPCLRSWTSFVTLLCYEIRLLNDLRPPGWRSSCRPISAPFAQRTCCWTSWSDAGHAPSPASPPTLPLTHPRCSGAAPSSRPSVPGRDVRLAETPVRFPGWRSTCPQPRLRGCQLWFQRMTTLG